MAASARPATETQKNAPLRQIVTALEEFARAARQTGQYPAYHPVMAAALERAHQSLLKLFPSDSTDPVRLTTSRSGLSYNADPLPRSGPGLVWLNRELRLRNIKTLYLRPGLQTPEVESLLQLLSSEPHEIREKGGATNWLASRGVRHIEAEQQDYRRLLRESEAALMQLAPNQESSGVQQMVRLCMGVLEKSLDTAQEQDEPGADKDPDPQHSLPARLTWLLDFISSAPNEANSAEAQAKSLSMGWESLLEAEITPADFLATGLGNLIQVSFEAWGENAPADGKAPARPNKRLDWERSLLQILRGLEPELRARLFRVPVVVSPGERDALCVLARHLTPPEIIRDIIFSHPDAAAGETSSALSRLFRRIMPNAARQAEIEPPLKERFLQEGMPEETYRNVIGLLLDSLAKERTTQGESSAFHLPEEEAGALGLFAPLDLSDLMVSLEPDKLARAHTEMLLNLLEHDCSPSEYASLCAELASWPKRWQEKGETWLALELLRALAKEATQNTRSPSYRLIASSALARLDTPEFVSWLAGIIPDSNPAEQTDLINLLARLGENAGNALLQFVFNEPEDTLVRAAALAMCQPRPGFDAPPAGRPEGEAGAAQAGEPKGGNGDTLALGKARRGRLLADALVSAPAERTLRVVRLLLSTGSPHVISPISAALRHPQVRVCIGIMQALGEFKAPGGEKLLLAGLTDAHWEVNAKAARALGEAAANLSAAGKLQVVSELCDLAKQVGLNNRTLAVRLAAIEALGRLGRPEAVPTLAELLETRGWFFPKARNQLYATAALALSNLPSPEVGRVLQNCANSRRTAVAKVCKPALLRWRERAGRGSS